MLRMINLTKQEAEIRAALSGKSNPRGNPSYYLFESKNGGTQADALAIAQWEREHPQGAYFINCGPHPIIRNQDLLKYPNLIEKDPSGNKFVDATHINSDTGMPYTQKELDDAQKEFEQEQREQQRISASFTNETTAAEHPVRVKHFKSNKLYQKPVAPKIHPDAPESSQPITNPENLPPEILFSPLDQMCPTPESILSPEAEELLAQESIIEASEFPDEQLKEGRNQIPSFPKTFSCGHCHTGKAQIPYGPCQRCLKRYADARHLTTDQAMEILREKAKYFLVHRVESRYTRLKNNKDAKDAALKSREGSFIVAKQQAVTEKKESDAEIINEMNSPIRYKDSYGVSKARQAPPIIFPEQYQYDTLSIDDTIIRNIRRDLVDMAVTNQYGIKRIPPFEDAQLKKLEQFRRALLYIKKAFSHVARRSEIAEIAIALGIIDSVRGEHYHKIRDQFTRVIKRIELMTGIRKQKYGALFVTEEGLQFNLQEYWVYILSQNELLPEMERLNDDEIRQNVCDNFPHLAQKESLKPGCISITRIRTHYNNGLLTPQFGLKPRNRSYRYLKLEGSDGVMHQYITTSHGNPQMDITPREFLPDRVYKPVKPISTKFKTLRTTHIKRETNPHKILATRTQITQSPTLDQEESDLTLEQEAQDFDPRTTQAEQSDQLNSDPINPNDLEP